MADLPVHIIESIVEYVGCVRRYSEDVRPSANATPAPKSIAPLLSVSSHWRHVACSYVYQTAGVNMAPPIYGFRRPVYACQLWRIIEVGRQDCVRQLQLVLEMDGLYDDTIHSSLRSILAAGGAKLHSVKEIMLIPSMPHVAQLDATKAGVGLNRVAALLKEHLPNVSSLVLECCYLNDFYGTNWQATAVSCLLRMADSPQRVSLPSVQFSRPPIDFSPPQHIRHMVVRLLRGDQSSGSGELVKRYAATLEKLVVHCVQPVDIHAMLGMGPDGQPVVYSKLHSLEIAVGQYGYREEPAPAVTVNPFPVLATYKCSGSCPLARVNVLRWVLPHLSTIETVLTDTQIGVLKDTCVFGANALPSLKSASLGFAGPQVSDDGSRNLVDEAFLWSLNLSHSVERIHTPLIIQDAASILHRLPALSSLQVLDLPKVPLTISTAIPLIGKFPSLVSFTFTFKTSDDVSKRGDLTDEEIVAFQKSVAPAPPTSLRTLGIHSFVFSTATRAADHILLLASIFKSIRRIKVRSLAERRNSSLQAAFKATKKHECFKSDYRLHYMPILLVEEPKPVDVR